MPPKAGTARGVMALMSFMRQQQQTEEARQTEEAQQTEEAHEAEEAQQAVEAQEAEKKRRHDKRPVQMDLHGHPVSERLLREHLEALNCSEPPSMERLIATGQVTVDALNDEQSARVEQIQQEVATMAAPPATLPVQPTPPVAEPGLRWWPQGPENHTFHTQRLKLRRIWV